MKGIIFNLVGDAVAARHGDDVWDDVLAQAGLDGVYTSLGTYPDEHLHRIVAAGAQVLDMSEDALTRDIGRAAAVGLSNHSPHFFSAHDSLMPFLLSLDDPIYAEVRQLDDDARPPTFWFDAIEQDSLTVHYRSERRLCALAEGMIEGAATLFGQTVELRHRQCMRDGADHCTITADVTARAAS